MAIYNETKVQCDLLVEHHIAIKVRRACKYYGSKEDVTCVLDNLEMTVAKGSIYALLGASGSGKTTLLSCLVGNRKLNSGEILVLDTVLGEKGSVSPGPRIGYMPQERALYPELTVWETMKYFGWIAGLATGEIFERLEVLMELLQIKDLDQQICTLSGGEERRISFAVVLLYRPDVLILDEPTVGLDPLLRESLWRYLLELVKNEGSTILLTTHYIEETRQAHIVGVMRCGYLIAEASPQTLLDRFQVGTMEEVFLKLSELQNVSLGSTGKRFSCDFRDQVVREDQAKCNMEVNSSSILQRVRALIWKQFLTMLRNPILLIFTVLSTSISVALFFLAYGHDPKSITVAVYLQSEAEGLNLLTNGQIHAHVIIKHNYSFILRERIMRSDSDAIRNRDFESTTIEVYRDFLAKDIAAFVKKALVYAFDDFIQSYLNSCNISSKLMKLPINWKDPVYGKSNVELTADGVSPFILMSAFFVASMVTSTSIVIEKSGSTYDRIFAMGVRHMEILVSHIISDFCLVLAQNIAMLIAVFWVFGLSSQGPIMVVIALVVLNSFCGMCFGYAIASILQSERTVMQFLYACMTPATVLSGTLWPREGMHIILQEAVWYLPLTHAAQSISSIINREWGLSKSNVYLAFINCFLWTIVCLVIYILCLRYKHR